MKISWGLGIAVSYIGFVILIIAITLYAHTIDVNLVADNYYEQEIKYQDQINKIARSKSLPEPITVKLEKDSIKIAFPSFFNRESVRGNILLFRPSDYTNDVLYKISLDNSNTQNISVSNLQSGLWKLKVDWQVDNIEYYNENIFMVN
jgi:hypothetical protein